MMSNGNGNSHSVLRIHGSCVSVGSRGVLLLGASGSGKSDLALRLMAKGALLVADDQVLLHAQEGYLVANVDDSIRGLLEIRGVGLVRYPLAANIPVTLAVQLVERAAIEHIPSPAVYSQLGVEIPQISLHGYDASTPEKVYAALHALLRNSLHTGFLPDKPEETSGVSDDPA